MHNYCKDSRICFIRGHGNSLDPSCEGTTQMNLQHWLVRQVLHMACTGGRHGKLTTWPPNCHVNLVGTKYADMQSHTTPAALPLCQSPLQRNRSQLFVKAASRVSEQTRSRRCTKRCRVIQTQVLQEYRLTRGSQTRKPSKLNCRLHKQSC